jgi:hypothetical protein
MPQTHELELANSVIGDPDEKKLPVNPERGLRGAARCIPRCEPSACGEWRADLLSNVRQMPPNRHAGRAQVWQQGGLGAADQTR